MRTSTTAALSSTAYRERRSKASSARSAATSGKRRYQYRMMRPDDKLVSSIAAQLHDAWKQSGLTYQQMAFSLGVKRSAIDKAMGMVNRDCMLPRLSTLVGLAWALGKRIEIRLVDARNIHLNREYHKPGSGKAIQANPLPIPAFPDES